MDPTVSRFISYPDGFHCTFENGWTLSVQWSEYHTCHGDGRTAEIASWPNGGVDDPDSWLWWESGGIKGYVTPDLLVKYMKEVSKLSPIPKEETP